MSDGRILQIFRDGRRTAFKTIQLPRGAQGNLETLAEMAKIVREDAALWDMRNFAMREIIGLEAQDIDAQIAAAYNFARNKIKYLPEGPTTETVADLWSCMYALNADHPVGDCVIKSVALATLLSYLKLRPYFVAIRQLAGTDYFDHVFVAIDHDGKTEALDPTPPEFTPGQRLPSFEYLNYYIFK